MTKKEEQELQRLYYSRRAGDYDAMHLHADDEHYVALGYIASLMDMHGLNSVLDVGSGTGRAVKYFSERGVHVRGIEPVVELIDQSVTRNGLSRELFTQGSGESLPFPSNSFDAVCEFAVLHHVPRPELVVAEMIRVARRLVCLSDSNRFGQGPFALRLVKLVLYKLGLWPLANWVKTRGRGYLITEGDGLSYSYSVYDSLNQLSAWADRILLLPTDDHPVRSWCHPLLTSGHVLVCAFRNDSQG